MFSMMVLGSEWVESSFPFLNFLSGSASVGLFMNSRNMSPIPGSTDGAMERDSSWSCVYVNTILLCGSQLHRTKSETIFGRATNNV